MFRDDEAKYVVASVAVAWIIAILIGCYEIFINRADSVPATVVAVIIGAAGATGFTLLLIGTWEVLSMLARRINERRLDEAREEGVEKGVELGVEKGRKEGREQGRAEGREEGRAEGRAEGREQGREEGLEQGREEGLEQGREEGRAEGREEGLEQGRAEGLEQGRAEGRQRLREWYANLPPESQDQVLPPI